MMPKTVRTREDGRSRAVGNLTTVREGKGRAPEWCTGVEQRYRFTTARWPAEQVQPQHDYREVSNELPGINLVQILL
jgi:hypothetical protein